VFSRLGFDEPAGWRGAASPPAPRRSDPPSHEIRPRAAGGCSRPVRGIRAGRRRFGSPPPRRPGARDDARHGRPVDPAVRAAAMSKAALRAFDRLLATKRRRIERFEAEAAQARQVQQACEQAHAQAAQQEQSCREAQADCEARLDALPAREGGFRPSDFVTLRHVLATLDDHTRKAARQAQQALQQAEQAREAAAQAQRRLQRAQQQLEQLGQRRAEMALRMEQAQEDAQDEESEETAVARLVAARIEAESEAR
jgi:hypothetical protein